MVQVLANGMRCEKRIMVYIFSKVRNKFVFGACFEYDEKRLARLRRNKNVIYEIEEWYW